MSHEASAKLLRIVSALLMTNAVIWASAAYPPLDIPAKYYLDTIHWPPGDSQPELTQNVIWLSSIGAGLLAALAVLFYGILAPLVEAGNRQAVRIAILAIIIWFIVDSIGSIASGVLSNAIFNIPLLLIMLLPLIFIRFKH